MRKYILLYTVIFAAMATIGFSSLGVSTDVKRGAAGASQNVGEIPSTGWELKSSNLDELKEEVADWAIKHYQLSNVAQNLHEQQLRPQNEDVPEQFLPKSQLSLEQFVQFDIVPIPEGRRVPGYEGLMPPTYHAVALLKDAHGDLYDVVLGSFDSEKKSFAVRSTGPFLDHTVEAISLPLEERRLRSWPPLTMAKKLRAAPNDANISDALSKRPKPVLIPYPYPVNQIYWQYGDDTETAVFESIHSGQIYQGLAAVLDAVDEDWRKLGESNQGYEKPARNIR